MRVSAPSSGPNNGCRQCISLVFVFSLSSLALALSERDTLLHLYGYTNGNRWNNSSGWKEAAEGTDDYARKHICAWHGVSCAPSPSGANQVVAGLDLANNNLSGKVPKHLWEMPFLTSVNFRGNLLQDAGFKGIKTDGGDISSLVKLDLSKNKLTSLKGISSEQQSLVELHIDSNPFEGGLPDDIFQLSKIKILCASSSGFTGTLPAAIGNLVNLHELDLSSNSLTGSLPAKIGSLEMLEYLSLDENKFIGTLPKEIENLVNLHYLSLRNSKRDSGEITGPLLAFRDLEYLRDLYLDGNALNGTFPKDFLQNSAITEKVVTIGLRQNKLGGKLPKELVRFENLVIDIQGNEMTGIHSDFCHKKKWMDFKVGDYGCDAIACPKGTYAKTGRRESSETPCLACPNGDDGAPFIGSQDCIMDMKDMSDSDESTDSPVRIPRGGLMKVLIIILAVLVVVLPIVTGITTRFQAQQIEEEASDNPAVDLGIVSESNTGLEQTLPAKAMSSTVSGAEKCTSPNIAASGDSVSSSDERIV